VDNHRLSSFVDNGTLSTNEDMRARGELVRDIAITDWSKFGATVKAERARQSLSQHDLAAKAGVSRSWLAKLEAGHRGAELEQILRLLDALGLTLVLRSEASESPVEEISARSAGTDDAARQVLDRQQRKAEIRRRAWAAARRADHG
jgi:y4mF family transcriptional regulator